VEVSTEPSSSRPTKALAALASLAASVATVLAVFVAPGDNGPGSAQAAASPSVARACRATQKGWDDQARREPAFRAAVRDGRTALAQRDAVINETQARIASSGAAVSLLRAAGSPGGDAGARYDRTLRAWSRNVRRLERYRDALSAASTFAELNRAAAANDRTRSAFENDAHTVMAGLQALGGDACELDPPPPTKVTHFDDHGGAHHDARPNVLPDAVPPQAKRPAKRPAVRPAVTPKRAATADVVPGDASPEPAAGPKAPDVSPGFAPRMELPRPDVSPSYAAPAPGSESGAATTTDGAWAP
jgi:hypothetical protein